MAASELEGFEFLDIHVNVNARNYQGNSIMKSNVGKNCGFQKGGKIVLKPQLKYSFFAFLNIIKTLCHNYMLSKNPHPTLPQLEALLKLLEREHCTSLVN